MKRFLKYILAALFIVTGAFGVYYFSNRYHVDILKDNISCDVRIKGCEGARAMAAAGDGKLYLAYKNMIKSIDKKGKEEVIFKDLNLSIDDITLIKDKLYFISMDKLHSLDLKKKSTEVILSKIPYLEGEIDRKILASKGELYISISSISNSGVMSDGRFGLDIYDRYPLDIKISGENFGDKNTGPLKAYGQKSDVKESIKGDKLGNGQVIKFNLKSKSYKTYASGIKDISGWDINSKDEIYALFRGMEDKGLRPVKNDTDYIYKLKEKVWYGWPDFSGGDPISSPRFSGEKVLKPIIVNPPNKVVQTPYYEYKNVMAISHLAIDSDGSIFSKDSMMFYDKNEKMVYMIDSNRVVYKLIQLNKNSVVHDIVYRDDEFYILDSGVGCIYEVKSKGEFLGFNLPTIVWVFILSFTIILLVIVLCKIMKNKKK